MRFYEPALEAREILDWVFAAIYNVKLSNLQILWIFPIYSTSFVLNNLWYQEIADISCKISSTKATSKLSYKKYKACIKFERFVSVIADEIYRVLLFMNFLIQTLALYLIPYVGPILTFTALSFVYAFYSFEYQNPLNYQVQMGKSWLVVQPKA